MSQQQDRGMSRRTFVGGAMAAAGAPFMIAPRHVVAGAEEAPPSEKLNIGAIGIGGVGARNLGNLAKENIAALCDLDAKYSEAVFASFPEARRYTDYREMLANDDLDGVVIATPDHTHAVIAMAALKAGKHVFCQKPLTHTIYEARTLAAAAKKSGLVTQMGIQGHAGDGTRRVCEWIAAGAIGEVREVEAFCTDSYYPWGHATWSPKIGARPTDTPPVPEGMDWDLWIGPAPMRPYHPCYHPRAWRAYQDFGSGWMSDRGVHTLDPVVWALGLGQPTRVDATCTGVTDEMHPVSAVVRFEFPARGDKPPVTVTWYTGLRPPRPREVPAGEPIGDRTGGILFKGSDGLLTCNTYGDRPRLLPAAKMEAFAPPEPAMERAHGTIEEDWVYAIKNGTKACADFSYGGPLTEVCAVGNIAKRYNATIEWDAKNMKVTNNEEANQYVRKQYREGWTL
ncbi:MAG: Gfo/Idh/MocA family oxidoreductase [bacterium]|nr:Gfo/Idh/MocA family oxidoreductase [bacterium]